MELEHSRSLDDTPLPPGFDDTFYPQPADGRETTAGACAQASADRLRRGHVLLDSAQLRRMRQARLMSQQDLADACWRRNIPLSLSTIKRAETGRAVRFRIAREFARCFDVPVARILREEDTTAATGTDAH